MPTITAAITTPEVSVIAVVGRPRPSASNSAPMPAAMAKPPARPSSRADDADRQRLHPHEPLDLTARSADRAQQSQRALLLRDRHRQRVRDRERTDDHGDDAEHEQDHLQRVDELLQAVEHEAVLSGGRAHAHRRGQAVVEPGAKGLRRRPGFGVASTVSSWPCLPNSCWAVCRSNSAVVAVPSERTLPNVEMPTIWKARCCLAVRGDLDRLARLQVRLVGALGVDHDFARTLRPAAGVEAERRELVGARTREVVADAEVRRGTDDLAVSDDLRLGLDLAGRGRDLRVASDALERRLRQRRACGGHPVVGIDRRSSR